MRWVLPVALVVLLSGCSDGGTDASPAPDGLANGAPDLQATATTGVLRGIVVDEAVRPLGNVTVDVSGPSGPLNARTDPAGFFGFQDLAPGAYFVVAAKLAYGDIQQSVDVVAGVDEPPLVRMQLLFVPSQAPFVTALKHEGFAQLIVPGANVGAIGNIYPCVVNTALGRPCENVTQDESIVYVHDIVLSASRTPDWAQVEMVWDSTQAFTDWLAVRMSAHKPGDGAGVDVRNTWVYSPSPLVFTQNRTAAEEWELGTVEGWALETFSGGNDMTCGALPVRACNGLVVNQQLSYFFHFFYAYVPPEGWLFSDTQAVPAPPE